MDVSINLLAVFLAAASTMVVGSIWYGKVGFGDLWIKLAKVKVDPNFGGVAMAVQLVAAFVASLVTAVVLAYFASISNLVTDNSYLVDSLLVGFLAWAGFTAARIHMHDSFEGRPKALTALTVSHEFVTVAVMALIIGLLGN